MDEKVVCGICEKEGDWTNQQYLKIGCHYGSDNDGMLFESDKVCPECIDAVVKALKSINPELKVEYYI